MATKSGSISRTKSRKYISQLKRQEVLEEQRNLEAQMDSGEDSATSKQMLRHESISFGIGLFIFQVIIIILYAIWVDYPSVDKAEENSDLYLLFRDVNVMIFFGFGFLMTFLRRYGYSAVGYTLLVSAVVVEWSVLVRGFFFTLSEGIDGKDKGDFHTIEVGIEELLDGLFCAGAVMISFGAVLGKTSPTQLLILAFIEPIFFFGNIALTIKLVGAIDVGGGMTIHTFGAYFGLAMTWFLTSFETRFHQDNTSCYSSDLFSLSGTIWLWMMWPSFNAIVAPTELGKVRALVNTLLSLCSCVLSAFIVSRTLGEHKFDVVHIQNSTLAGGVVMGVAADFDLHPTAAMTAGFVAGVVSVLGYHYLTPYLSQKMNIQDVCGVHNLHGMPGVLSCIVGIFATLHASQDHTKYPDPGEFYKMEKYQAVWQAISLAITLGVAIAGGIITGFLMKAAKKLRTILAKDFFNDRTFWNLPSDYDMVINRQGETPIQEVVVHDHPSSVERKGSNSSITKRNNVSTTSNKNSSVSSTGNKGKKEKVEMQVFQQPDESEDSDSDSEDSGRKVSARSPAQPQRQASPALKQHQQQEEDTEETVSSQSTEESED